MTDIDDDTFEAILDNSIQELSLDLGMNTIGASMNQMLHICADFADIDPHALDLFLQACAAHARKELDAEGFEAVIVVALNALQQASDASHGLIPLH